MERYYIVWENLNGNIVTLTILSLLAAPEVAKMRTSCATSDKSAVKMMTLPLQ